jgi:hypothetical protein
MGVLDAKAYDGKLRAWEQNVASRILMAHALGGQSEHESGYGKLGGMLSGRAVRWGSMHRDKCVRPGYRDVSRKGTLVPRAVAVSLFVLLAALHSAPLYAQAQPKAGQVTKSNGPAFVVQPPPRAGAQPNTVAATPGTAFRWHDTLKTEDAGRIRAQLNDGSILSIGQKTSLIVTKHDERTQQSTFELQYGAVRANVQHLARPDSNFEIRTQTAVCGVLGTDEAVDANDPTATVVISISGIVTVRSSSPNVVGSVQLSPGQTTTVRAGQPPTQPTPATSNQLTGIATSTGGSTTPDPTVSNPTPTVQVGRPLTIDGRASTGGLGTVASYNWQIVNGLNQTVNTSSNPVLNVDTTSWMPGSYTGTLTVVNTATPPQSATVSFTFTVAAPDPGPTIPALAAAYQTGQVRSFMNLFDSTKYTGYSALEQSITQSFNNIAVTGVNVLTAAGANTGAATAHYNVTLQIGYTLKNTALPVAATTGSTVAAVPPQLRAMTNRAGAPATGTGSISGSAGAVATFVVLSGPVAGFVQSANNLLSYSFTGLPDGTYTLTPLRSGFTFTPASLTVTIKNGAAVTGQDFAAQPQPLTIQANAILDLGYVPGTGWLFTNISGSLGAAGVVGVPGTSNPTANTPVAPVTTPQNTPGTPNAPTQVVPTFTITPPAIPVPVVVGNQTTAIPVTITPVNGFVGSVAMNFTFATGISLVSGPTAVNITSSNPVTVNYVFAAAGSTNPGTAGVLFAATSGTIGPVIGGISLNVTQVFVNVIGNGSSPTTPLQLFAGNGSASATLAVSPVLPGEALTISPVSGINAAVTALNASGNATITITPTGSATGAVSIPVNVLVSGSVANSTVVYLSLVAPVANPSGPGTVSVAPGQPVTFGINVPFNGTFAGPVTVTAPTGVAGLAFSPPSQTLTASGTATFTVTASQAFVQAIRRGAGATNAVFTITAGSYSTTVPVSFTTVAAADFTLSLGNSLTLSQNSQGNITINVVQSGGIANIPITLSASGFPAGISATPVGSATVNGSGSVTFNVLASIGAATGTPTFTVTGSSGTLSHPIQVPATITPGGSFNLTAAVSGTFFDGGGACAGCVTVSVTPVGTFTAGVTITSASTVATATGPASINPGSQGIYTVTATGAGTLTFTGTSGTITQTASVTITPVIGFALGVSATPSFPGGSSTVTVTVNRASGFTGAVVITPASSAGVSFSPASATVAAGATGATFTASIAGTATGGSVSAGFSGTAQGGTIAVAGSGSINIANVPFTLSAGSVSGFSGQTVPITVTVTPNAGFNGAVVVTPIGGVSGVVITPASVTVPAGSTTANFVVTIPSTVTSGGSIQFTGVLAGGTLSANTTANLNIVAPFTLAPGAALASFFPGATSSGQVGVTLASGFAGPVTLSAAVTGVAKATLASASVTTSGNVTLTVTSDPAAAPGSSNIVVTAQAGTFSATATYTVAIVQAALTIAANNKSRPYGANNPSFDATYTGFVNGDTQAALTGTLTCTTPASSGSPAGSYAITCSGQSAPKYAITYVPGTLSVTSAPLTIAANNTTRQFGAGNPTFGASYSGFVNGDGQASLGGTLVCTSTATAASPTGTYSITCAGQSSTNYTINYVSGTLTITSASSTTGVASNANPSPFGQALIFTATVTAVAPASSNPTGSVTFLDGTATLGSGTLANGQATFSSSTLAAGSHSITAVYGGDANFTGSTSTALTQMIGGATPNTTTVRSSASPSTFGQSVTFTATVNPNTATGTVTFKDGSTTLGTGTLSAGSATFATSALSVGTHSITAVYGGDNTFATSTSTALSQVVNQASSTTAVSSATNPSTFGQSVTFTATVTLSAATGTVTFKDGSTTLGTGTLSAGSATFATSALSVGTHSITAVYGGDTNFAGSTSTSLSQVVGQASSTTALNAAPNPSAFGQSVTFTATVTASTATGTVTFKDGTATLGTGTLSNGSATFTTSTLATGNHSITAVYSGDANFTGSTSSVTIQSVGLAASTTALTSGTNPSAFGQSVMFTATVSPNTATGTPTGSVTFKDGTTALGTGTLSSGVATFSTASLTAGTHSITAVYSGDSSFGSSTSAAVLQVVGQGSSTTAVTSAVNPSTFGQSVTFTATVTPSGATGTVTFKDGSTALGTGTLSAGSATFSTATLAVGAHAITAVYGGDATFTGSTSTAVSQAVNQAASTSAVGSATNPSTFGQSVTFTATVTPSTATGTVTFKDGSTTLGAGTLSGGSATFVTSALSVATHSITAVYGGDTNFAGSTSTSLSQVVGQGASTTALNTAPNPAAFGQAVTFTATVTPGTATGTVTFKDGTATLGAGTLSSGSATLTTSTLATGNHSITAVYSGDANFTGSTSSATIQSVGLAASTTALASGTNPSAFAQSVTFTATVSPNTATGTVIFKDGSTTLGTGTLSSGSATFATAALSVGTHSITAVYGGDANFGSSTSTAVSQVVNQSASTTALTSSANPSTSGQSVTFTAMVTPSAATGTVTFKDGGTALGTGTLTSGTATFSTSTLATGTHSITAVYGGDSTYGGSTSAALSQGVGVISSTTSVNSSTNPSTYGQSVTLTATVSPSTATGTVTFKDGSTALGTGTLASGSATLAVTALGSGSHSITAVYGGDSNNGGSTSTALTQNVNKAPLTITANNQTITAGASFPAFTASYSGLMNGDTAASLIGTLSCTTSATSSGTPGTYSITCSGQTSGNYQITYAPGTLTIVSNASGSVGAGSAGGSAGSTVNVPVTLTLNGSTTIDSVSFGFLVTPNGSAPAVTSGTLSFAAGPTMPTPTFVDAGAGPNVISVSWLNLSTPLSGSVILGSVSVKIPGTAASGQTYTVSITGVRGSLGTSSVTLVSGSNGMLTSSAASPAAARATASVLGSGLAMKAREITYTPAIPREGDKVLFRVPVRNGGSGDVHGVLVALLAQNTVMASQRIDVSAGGATTAELEWTADRATARQLHVAIDPGHELSSSNIVVSLKRLAVDRRATLPASSSTSSSPSSQGNRLTVMARNEACTGVRLTGASQASCGGSADLEVAPSITAAGTLEVRLAVPNGGLRDLGTMPLSAAQLPDGSDGAPVQLQSQALFQEGHTYLVKLRNQLAFVRVARIRSSVNPRLAVLNGSPGVRGSATNVPSVARTSNGDMLGDARNQQQVDRVLGSAQISIDLEWSIQPSSR